ncbi:xyloglucanase-specific endoglucanase inhibitor protein [Medicago truncatula]|uniref:Xyloglucanase-specific endoglucanase inhibitor protein n=1 Tax=Medicago truncatula TaxID=3880 RepID=G7I470_MEDTR|nr:xyloglucanase-specific endoglucanase inhibitor protein [Medicago truncatula]
MLATSSNVLIFTPFLTNPVSTTSYFLGEKTVEYIIGMKSIRVSDKNVKLSTTLLSIHKNGFGGTKISPFNPYTIMETSINKAVSCAFVIAFGVSDVQPVAPFGTCFATKDINETVKWNIIGDKSMVSIGNNDVICLVFLDVGSDAANASQVGFVLQKMDRRCGKLINFLITIRIPGA